MQTKHQSIRQQNWTTLQVNVTNLRRKKKKTTNQSGDPNRVHQNIILRKIKIPQ